MMTVVTIIYWRRTFNECFLEISFNDFFLVLWGHICSFSLLIKMLTTIVVSRWGKQWNIVDNKQLHYSPLHEYLFLMCRGGQVLKTGFHWQVFPRIFKTVVHLDSSLLRTVNWNRMFSTCVNFGFKQVILCNLDHSIWFPLDYFCEF